MREILKHKGIIIASSILLLLTLTGLTMREDGRRGSLGEALSIPLLPLRKIFNNISREIEDNITYFRDLKALTEENERLKEALSAAIIEKTELEALRQENEELKKAFNFAQRHHDYSLLPAYVSGRETDNWNDFYIIDVGRKNGIDLSFKKDYPGTCAVVNGDGLVGRIIQTFHNSSKLLSIIDHGSTVSGVLTRSRYNVEVKGLFELKGQGLCYVDNINYDVDIAVGDYVETAGIGENYPRGVLIGVIVSVNRDESTKTVNALLKPAVDFKRLGIIYTLMPKEME